MDTFKLHRLSAAPALVPTAFVMAWQEGWFQQEDFEGSLELATATLELLFCMGFVIHTGEMIHLVGGRARGNVVKGACLADHIAQQLATLLDRQDKIDNTMVTMASEMKELTSQCVFGSGQQSYSWNHPYFHASWEAIPGPTHFVEIPVVKVTEKVIEVPRFIEKVASCGGQASLEPQAEKTATAVPLGVDGAA